MTKIKNILQVQLYQGSYLHKSTFGKRNHLVKWNEVQAKYGAKI